jgi:hypothetical protein
VFGIDEEISELVETSGDGSRRGDEGGTLSVSRVDEGGPVMRLVNSIIRRVLVQGASDIRVEPRTEELVIRHRVDGVLKHGMSAPLHLKDSVISRFKILGDLDISVQWLRLSIGIYPDRRSDGGPGEREEPEPLIQKPRSPTLVPRLPRTEIDSSDTRQCTRAEVTVTRVNSGYCSLGCHETFATPNPAAVVRSFLVSPSTIICTVIVL